MEHTRVEKHESWEPQKTLNLQRKKKGKFLHMPSELCEEILQKLPVKSLVRFKSISKQWRSTIESQDFVERHLIRQKSRDPKIFIGTNSESQIHRTATGAAPFTSLSIGSVPIEEEEEICRCYTLPYRFRGPLQVSESFDGLFCIYGAKSVYVLNPVTRELRQLPAKSSIFRPDLSVAPNSSCTSVGFCRDDVTGTYKVVRMYDVLNRNCRITKCEVFALNAGAWRYIGLVPYEIYFLEKPVYANGSLHWFDSEVNQATGYSKIVAFDVHTEKFRVFPHPGSFLGPAYLSSFGRMFSLRKHLCILEFSNPRLHIWSMSPDERWEKTYWINIYNHIGSWENYRPFMPLEMCKNGRIAVTDGEELLTYCLETEDFRLVCVRKGIMAPYFESLVSPFQ